MPMRLPIAFALAFLLTLSGLHAADEAEALFKTIIKEARAGGQEALAPLKQLHSHKSAADTVLALVTNQRVGLGVKLRLAEIVSEWPQGDTRRTLAEWLLKHPDCHDNELMFYAAAGLVECRIFFWSILVDFKTTSPSMRHPSRIALAARALGSFQDNPETVVAQVASLLTPANPHVIRASAADALGGMRHRLAIESLIPHLDDDAIGSVARRSLYRLTGTDFIHDRVRWKTWLSEVDAQIPWKMLTRLDFENYLKLQKLLKPLDDTPGVNLAAFYGVEVRTKAALFILDVSGSMDADGRIDQLKAQVGNLLVAMRNKPEELRYGLITFGEDIESCFSRGLAANHDKSFRQAERFIDRVQADGGTQMCAALTHALTRILPGGNVDAIYFLSDGQPTDGTPEQVLELARRIHEEFQVRIHTISIGEEPAANPDTPSLLHQISKASDGTFTIPP